MDEYNEYRGWLSGYQLSLIPAEKRSLYTSLAQVLLEIKQKKEQGMNRNQLIIGSLKDSVFSARPNPRTHDNQNDACREAERLARNEPGKQFVVLQVVGIVEMSGVNWK